MGGHHVSTNKINNVSMAYSGSDIVQLVENGQDSIHWLIVRGGSVEQKVALSFSQLLLLCKAVSILPEYERAKSNKEGV